MRTTNDHPKKKHWKPIVAAALLFLLLAAIGCEEPSSDQRFPIAEEHSSESLSAPESSRESFSSESTSLPETRPESESTSSEETIEITQEETSTEASHAQTSSPESAAPAPTEPPAPATTEPATPAPTDPPAPTEPPAPAPTNPPAPAPEPTTPAPTDPPAPAPTVPPSGTITVLSYPEIVHRNEMATVSIQGLANTNYNITVYYKSGPSEAAGLEAKMSDANGFVSWTWKVGGRTSAGTFRIVVSGGGDSITIPFTVVV